VILALIGYWLITPLSPSAGGKWLSKCFIKALIRITGIVLVSCATINCLKAAPIFWIGACRGGN